VRLHLHLADQRELIRDHEGIEVEDLNRARVEIVNAVHELRRETALTVQDWSGWRLDVTDAQGAVVLSLDLDTIDA
jgi:hypothetical protein